MKIIKLTRHKIAIVDDQDYYWLIKFKWCFDGRYAQTRINNKTIRMHQMIMGKKDGHELDHHNHNKLDNRRSNIRFSTRNQNNSNKLKTTKPKSSKYKGCSLIKSTGKWRASITFNKKATNLGHYDSEEDAARVFDRAAIKYHKDFAFLNFPNDINK